MKGYEFLKAVACTEMPDKEQLRAICIHQAESGPSSKRRGVLNFQRLIPAAACILVLLVGTLIFTRYNDMRNIIMPPSPMSNGAETSDSSHSGDNANTWAKDIKGLPVDNFTMQELSLNSAMCRAYVWGCLPNFFEKQWATDSFVIVKVTDIQAEPPEYEKIEKFGEIVSVDRSLHRQISTVNVQKHIWGETTPESFQIVQYHSSGTVGPTNTLRKGGVYLLPLRKYVEDTELKKFMDEEYEIVGDLDVLFEINDAGLIYSHSDFENLNWFDNKPYSVLANAIVNVAQSPDLPLMLSRFGKAVLTEKIAQVEITADIPNKDSDSSELLYQARASFNINTSSSSDMPIRYYFSDDVSKSSASLKKGSSYLMFGYIESRTDIGTEFSVGRDNTAEILPDGRIRALTSDSVFAKYNGYTVEQIKALLERINAYKTS